ncbi:GNAT family N-acetyltransferase [Dyadobacter sp. BHUBP1]|uniref:GNAT family N-acetyltransferase n=1 Tax=Dyadobacter sp. BHUBP1 TaxID=3424178 RepID=UPI003D33BDD0
MQFAQEQMFKLRIAIKGFSQGSRTKNHLLITLLPLEKLSNMQLHNLDLFKEQLPYCFGKSDFEFAHGSREIDFADYLKRIVTDVKLPKKDVETVIRQHLFENDVMSNFQNILTYKAIDFFYNQQYDIDSPSGFQEGELQTFLDLLVLQGKIVRPTMEKVKRCRYLALCKVGTEIVSIGAIKPKTDSVFGEKKANLPEYAKNFDYELGYCYTLEEYRRKGYGSDIVRRLLTHVNEENLMATTELDDTNRMINILENRGFTRKGQSFQSRKHTGKLGLFLRFHE